MSADPSLAPTDPVMTSDSIVETTSTAEESAPRVTLSPTGAEEFKAVGSIAPAKLEENRERSRDIDADAERETRLIREAPIPRQQPSVEVPLEQELDAALEAEINAAMGGGAISTEGALGIVTTAIAEAPAEETLHQGKRIKGKVSLLHGEDMFLDLGFRSQGILPLKQYEGKEIPARCRDRCHRSQGQPGRGTDSRQLAERSSKSFRQLGCCPSGTRRRLHGHQIEQGRT